MTSGAKQLISALVAGAALLACALGASAQQAATTTAAPAKPAAAPPAPPAPVIAPARQQILEAHMQAWNNVKNRANQFGENILQNIGTNKQIDYSHVRMQVQTGWAMAQSLEKKAFAWQQQGLGQLGLDLAARKITQQQQASCIDALNKTLQLRLLYIYGTLLPQSLDDSIRQYGRSAGSQYAGPQWQLEATPEEKQALAASYGAECPSEPSLFVEN